MKTTATLRSEFLAAAQALADRMVAEIRERDPAHAAGVEASFADGHAMSVAYTFAANAASIELGLRGADHVFVRVASIPLEVPGPSNRH